MSGSPTAAAIAAAPKVLLHDHLDGGLRPATLIELAASCGYDALPTTDAERLRHWFFEAANSGSLERYLETFAHTLAVMQTVDGIRRVAAECVEDLAADGVVYAEVRFAPELHQSGGLSLHQVVEAVLAGFEHGTATAESSGHKIRVRALLTAMRQADRSAEIARLVADFHGREVAGFDLAGPEAGFPPTDHAEAFDLLRDGLEHITIHAGEGDGLASIRAALTRCGAQRLGHGIRVADDITVGDPPHLGRLAEFVLDRRIPLEIAPTSNLQTGIAATMAEHPVGLLIELGFAVTINTDNRLMSDVTLTSELAAVAATFGYGWDELERLAVTAMRAAFLPHAEREAIIDTVIRPAYAALRG